MMFRLLQSINSQILPRLGIRMERFSTYRAREQERRASEQEQQRLEKLRTSALARNEDLSTGSAPETA